MSQDWDRQFAESDDERAERWRQTKAKRRAEGRCWQCAEPVASCCCGKSGAEAGSAPLVLPEPQIQARYRGLPDVEPPKIETDPRTTRQILLEVESKLNKLLQALDEEEDEDPNPLTLDGSYAGRERDQTESLG